MLEKAKNGRKRVSCQKTQKKSLLQIQFKQRLIKCISNGSVVQAITFFMCCPCVLHRISLTQFVLCVSNVHFFNITYKYAHTNDHNKRLFFQTFPSMERIYNLFLRCAAYHTDCPHRRPTNREKKTVAHCSTEPETLPPNRAIRYKSLCAHVYLDLLEICVYFVRLL